MAPAGRAACLAAALLAAAAGPLCAQASDDDPPGERLWTPLPILGLGLHAVGNVNGTEFFGGLTLSVDIGWVP